MARRRFFVSGIHHQQAELTGDDAHHLVRVLRVEPGQRYEISDGTSAYLATVTEARKNRVVFEVGERIALKPLPVRITLAFALIKFDRLEWILEKGTEAGVAEFIPVMSERSEAGLDRAVNKRRERWERIIVEAAQQSRRDVLPVLQDLRPVRQTRALAGSIRLLLDEDASAPPILTALPVPVVNGAEVTVMVGPEGGWTDEERTGFVDARWTPVSLGPQILRAETAALVGASIVMSAWQAWAK